MTSQYALIAGQWPELHEEALLVEWVCANDGLLQITVTSLAEVPYALGLFRQSLERQLEAEA